MGEVSDEEEEALPAVSGLVENVAGSEVIADGTYVICTAGSSRRLHQVGRCWRKPGVDFVSYEAHGSVIPEAGLYKSRCKFCWPTASQARASRSPASSASSSSSSS